MFCVYINEVLLLADGQKIDMMDDKTILQEAFTEMAPRYETLVDGELNRFWGWRYDQFINRLLEEVDIVDGLSVLDVATGTAMIPKKLIGRYGDSIRIVGLDITLAMLRRGKKLLDDPNVRLVCGSAMTMPYGTCSFDVVLCGLATHHMDIPVLISEIRRTLKPGGKLTIADVGGSAVWRMPIVRFFLKVMAFIYFLTVENAARAWAEADGVSNVLCAEDWANLLSQMGFKGVTVVELPSKFKWIPSPLLIKATRGG
ncbi:MAG: methyltransferase domain-containing protein [Anaerolineae bacterium]|nr:methyltransferase domain-containing protein [Anaerolineae bacterium]